MNRLSQQRQSRRRMGLSADAESVVCLHVYDTDELRIEQDLITEYVRWGMIQVPPRTQALIVITNLSIIVSCPLFALGEIVLESSHFEPGRSLAW